MNNITKDDAIKAIEGLFSFPAIGQYEQGINAGLSAALKAVRALPASEDCEKMREALRPFASIVGKRGTPVTIQIGNDTWTSVLTTDHFEAASVAFHSGNPAYEAWKKSQPLPPPPEKA